MIHPYTTRLILAVMHSVLYIPKEGKVCSAVEKKVMLDFIKRMYRQRLVLSYHRFGGEIMFINESLTYPERDTMNIPPHQHH